jgi:hypothetical protein
VRAEEDSGPRDGVVDGEVDPIAAARKELAAAVTAAEAPLIPIVIT